MKPNLLVDYQFAVASGDYRVRALLKLEGRPPVARDRLPLNLSVVLDRSGSMGGGKLAAARDAAALLVRRLAPEDVVSVVAFDDAVETVATPAVGSEQDGVIARIGQIATGGMTNLSGGWLRGRELVASRRTPEGVNRVLLLTDGMANVGITNHDVLTGLCREAAGQGITTTTIGFGADYDQDLLRAMADAGGGHTYYIERADQAPGVFEEEIEGLIGLSAQNVAVEVRPAPAAALTVVYHSYPRLDLPDGVRLEVGDLFAREPRKVLIEFTVPGVLEGVDQDIATVRLTAAVVTDAGGVEQQEITLPIRASLDRAGLHEPEIQREVLFAGAAAAREAALDAERRGDFESGLSSLRSASDRISREAAPDDLELREEVEDLAAMSQHFEARNVSELDRKYLSQRSHDSLRSKRSAIERIMRTRKDAAAPSTGAPIQFARGDATAPVGPGRKLVVHVAADDGGTWGTGISKTIEARWPEARQRYVDWAAHAATHEPFSLGHIQITPVEATLSIATLVAKRGGNGHRRAVSYRALDAALARLGEEAERMGVSVHMPRIACAAAGGEWHRIQPMVEANLSARGVPVTVYDLA